MAVFALLGSSALVVCCRVGVKIWGWWFGGQNIDPTVKINCRKVINKPDILRGGASTSPPNPTGIGGGRADN
jgi:hypothetical protein